MGDMRPRSVLLIFPASVVFVLVVKRLDAGEEFWKDPPDISICCDGEVGEEGTNHPILGHGPITVKCLPRSSAVSCGWDWFARFEVNAVIMVIGNVLVAHGGGVGEANWEPLLVTSR